MILLITPQTVIQQVVQKYPEAITIFDKHGLHCLG
ncbi:DUF1858 domain-containing protein [Metallumcola ferriviriculae]